MFIADSAYPVAKPIFTANALAAQEHTRLHPGNQALPDESQLPETALPGNVKKSSRMTCGGGWNPLYINHL